MAIIGARVRLEHLPLDRDTASGDRKGIFHLIILSEAKMTRFFEDDEQFRATNLHQL